MVGLLLARVRAIKLRFAVSARVRTIKLVVGLLLARVRVIKLGLGRGRPTVS